MRSIAFADFLIGLGILFVLEGLLFAASPAWMRRAMKSALATPDNILRVVGIGSAVEKIERDDDSKKSHPALEHGQPFRGARSTAHLRSGASAPSGNGDRAYVPQKKCCAINVIVSGSAGFSPYSQGHDRSK